MDPISRAVDEIKRTIPREIIEAIFIRDLNDGTVRRNFFNTSVDKQIIQEVIRTRVLIDCDLIGGTEILVDLSGVPSQYTNMYTAVYQIPKSLTHGRSIISALNITYSSPFTGDNYGTVNGAFSTNACDYTASPLMQEANNIMNASVPVPIMSTAEVQLIGENTVMVRGSTMLPPNIYLRCRIGNDENMNHLQIRAYKPFATACILAVKSHIYNERIIRMDQAELFGGLNLGKFKEIVESYADAEELYQTFLKEKLMKVLHMNDRETHARHIQTLMGVR